MILAGGLPGLSILPAAAATSAAGGINVEPAARPWQYIGANPDGWWCPSASQCTTSNPLGRIDTEMGLAQQLHVANVRVEIPWFLVEPSNGGYNWSRADYIFNSATNHGVVIQPILVYTPAWGGGYNAFPAAADFQSFVTAFMGRYGSRINAVEMWNEPDGGQSLVANNPALYVQRILIPGYNAVKSTHANVKVIEGGSINDSGTCCPWLSGIYAAGGGNYFDIAAFHDYGGNYGQIVNAYRNVLNAHGQSGKPIWMGEYGVSDATGSQQSSLIRAALTSTPGLAMAQFYTLRDESVYTCCPPAATGEHKQYGVVAADDVTKKSSFATMQSLLGGSSPPPLSSPKATPPATTPPAKASPAPTPSSKANGHSPSPSGASPGHSGPSSPGASSPGAAAGSPSALAAHLVRAINGSGLQFFGFVLLLVGALVFVLGLGFAMNPAALAGRAGAWRAAILARGSAVGFTVATAGAAVCLLAIFLLSRLPQSG